MNTNSNWPTHPKKQIKAYKLHNNTITSSTTASNTKEYSISNLHKICKKNSLPIYH